MSFLSEDNITNLVLLFSESVTFLIPNLCFEESYIYFGIIAAAPFSPSLNLFNDSILLSVIIIPAFFSPEGY